MRIIDLKPVKRCGNCYRLRPADFQKCPYCEGSYTLKRVAGNSEEEPERPERKPLSPEAKKRLIIIALAAVAVGLIIAGTMYVMSMFRLDKSIMQPLSDKDVMSIEKDNPGFYEKYAMIEKMREIIVSEQDKAEFGNITYKQMVSFLDVYTDTAYCNNAVREARKEFDTKYHQPLLPKIEAEKKKWDEFLSEHDPNNYLKIACGQRYEENYGMYYPGFYLTLSYPKGAIEDCYVHYGLVSKGSEDGWHYSANTYGSLSDLQLRTKESTYRWNNVYSYSRDIYDNYEMKCDIISVTLPDGTVISKNDINEVPSEAKAYMEDPSPLNELAFIRKLVDTKYPSESEYVIQAVDKKFEAENALCHKLVQRTNSSYSVVDRGITIPTGIISIGSYSPRCESPAEEYDGYE